MVDILGAIGAGGSLLGGLGSLAGALGLGKSDQGVRGKDIKDALKAQLAAASIYGPQFGFHPLAALGMQPVNVGFRQAGGTDFAQMGVGLNKILNSAGVYEDAKLERQYKLERNKQMELETKQMEAELDKKAKITGMKSNTITEENLPLLNQKRNIQPRKTKFTKQGYEYGTQALEKISIGEGGYISTAPTEGLEDYISESLLGQVQYELPKAIRAVDAMVFTDRTMQYLSPGTFRKVTKEITKYLRNLEKSHNPGKGWQYVWSVERGQPRRMRILGGRKNVYDFSSKPYLRTYYR